MNTHNTKTVDREDTRSWLLTVWRIIISAAAYQPDWPETRHSTVQWPVPDQGHLLLDHHPPHCQPQHDQPQHQLTYTHQQPVLAPRQHSRQIFSRNWKIFSSHTWSVIFHTDPAAEWNSGCGYLQLTHLVPLWSWPACDCVWVMTWWVGVWWPGSGSPMTEELWCSASEPGRELFEERILEEEEGEEHEAVSCQDDHRIRVSGLSHTEVLSHYSLQCYQHSLTSETETLL